MIITTGIYPLAISRRFAKILETGINTRYSAIPKTGFILNFRDPDYSAEHGGYHPVEVMVDGEGTIQYITDFSWVGRSPHVDLAKELDFDLQNQLFGHFGRDFPLHQGKALYRMWQANFCQYHAGDIYKLTVTRTS